MRRFLSRSYDENQVADVYSRLWCPPKGHGGWGHGGKDKDDDKEYQSDDDDKDYESDDDKDDDKDYESEEDDDKDYESDDDDKDDDKDYDDDEDYDDKKKMFAFLSSSLPSSV